MEYAREARPEQLRIHMDVQRVKEQVQSTGWIWLPANDGVALPDLTDAFGFAVRPRLGGKSLVELRPYSRLEAPKSTMSAVVGHCAQPMHTDAAYYPLPPRYVILSCIDPGESICPTQLWILNWHRMLEDRPMVLTIPGWTAHGGGHSPFYCQVLTPTANRDYLIRFDPLCMKPPAGAKAELLTTVFEVLRSYSYGRNFLWKTGAMLIFDNWRCLHARGPGSDLAPSRRLTRWMGG